MSQTFTPPELTEEHKQRLMQARALCQNVEEFIRRCERAGIDCSDYKHQCEQLSTLAGGMIREFVNPKRRQ